MPDAPKKITLANKNFYKRYFLQFINKFLFFTLKINKF